MAAGCDAMVDASVYSPMMMMMMADRGYRYLHVQMLRMVDKEKVGSWNCVPRNDECCNLTSYIGPWHANIFLTAFFFFYFFIYC